ncbi:hypothetical protein B0H67DRAFT_357614 [Lasiosphaeris hirsuta]|uniref:Uncharacterized protein n=1 Tax=Lasiosphaeris hirsuta TaxID=260670 RepID=A0AA39ZW12_9PEZI|nr:hypothetical protein B0H67DRAFT_357614 [Lasiosphaeris hirsuta]
MSSYVPSNDLSPTLKFLTDAGHLLATTSPQISAFCMRQRDKLAFEHKLPQPEPQREHVCGRCGHIMIPGQGSTLSFKPKTSLVGRPRSVAHQKLKGGLDKEQHGPTKVLTCGHCGRVTELKLPTPARISRRDTRPVKSLVKAIAPGKIESSQTSSREPQKTNANASSKKRAKSRKAGLQALLEQSNASKGSRSGLSLADFIAK